VAPFGHRLDDQRDQRQDGQQRGYGKRGHRLVFVVEDFDMQRQGVGLPAYVARDHRHRAELAHGPRIAQNHAVDQAPLDVGQRDVPEGLPAGRAQHDGGLLFVVALRLHQRDQLARDERKGHEHSGQHNPRHGKNNLDVMRHQPGPKPALRAEDQHVDQAGHHGRDRKRQVDQRRQYRLAAKLVLGNRPGCGHTKDQVQRHGNRGGDQRQLDGRPGIGLAQRGEVGAKTFSQGLGEHGGQRQHQEQHDKQQRHGDQRVAHPGRFGGAGAHAAVDRG
jgi:hypothetical protein